MRRVTQRSVRPGRLGNVASGYEPDVFSIRALQARIPGPRTEAVARCSR
ncbi:hypothetical protein C8E95_5831 [Pseudonocardia autotrophica]|uniref:Uncharacterized protein n=1 Tax=Pseudonocardia autotrophica TaxID=2074 RepID=A0A1Y2MLM6_PSEAH|nr:hypothetical protein BG845_05581 [Pseudonocardia autotrophica]TDN65690.1 hypothetical protein C8E95_7208 [Pseudonocardia autotrophica]TDN76616.1 hypothetical protein C8E95_5831 [Pseudonocardia autotrophica]